MWPKAPDVICPGQRAMNRVTAHTSVLQHFPATNLLGRASRDQFFFTESTITPTITGLFYISCLQIRYPLFYSVAHFLCKDQRVHILGFEGHTDSITTTHWRGSIRTAVYKMEGNSVPCSDKTLFTRTSSWQIWLMNQFANFCSIPWLVSNF